MEMERGLCEQVYSEREGVSVPPASKTYYIMWESLVHCNIMDKFHTEHLHFFYIRYLPNILNIMP